MPTQADASTPSEEHHEDHYSDGESPEPSSAPGKPGRKKNPNSQAARRDQNRIAQREFRLRKQQRIRDLEARVELLSGTKDETVGELRHVVKDLMHENSTLRSIIKSLSAYIGDGNASIVSKYGFNDSNEFDSYINRSETDTAVEGFQRRKRLKEANGGQLSATSTAPTDTNSNNKRPAENNQTDPNKRRRNGSVDSPANGALPSLMTMNQSTASFSDLYPARQDETLFSDLFRGPSSSLSAMFTASPPGDLSAFSAQPLSQSQQPYVSFPQSSGNAVNSGHHHSTSFDQAPGPSMSGPTPTSSADSNLSPDADESSSPRDAKGTEAAKLIFYHLQNYKRNTAYCLPASLRPTLVQRTVPHEGVIDSIIHPDLRDRMILLRGRYDLIDCLHDLREAMSIHGDDVLDSTNWEVSEIWLRKYGFLASQALLDVSNRWRRERGEREILMADLENVSVPN